MSRIYLYILLSTVIFAQTSIDDLSRLNNRQLDDLRDQLTSANADSSSMKSTNITNEAISKVKISVDKKPKVYDSEFSKVDDLEFFGYDYFENNINFYDNIPTPSNYKLGPGDEIMLSLWGETNLRESFIINKEGLIYFKNVGFINLSNKTLNEAEDILVIELSKIFSTLSSDINPTNLMIELGKIRSLNVYFTGQVKKPGINLIHPFSDVFSAIVQAGGIKSSGSLRNIKIIREDREELSVDFYDFFTKGTNNFSNFKILDGDIIHVPPILIRASLDGEVFSPGQYELIKKETVSDLINYAGGLSASAANSALFTNFDISKDRMYDDYAFSTESIFYENYNDIELTNGDKIKILSISDVKSTVQVYGMVKAPGEYPASSNLKEVLDLSGGFNDPIFKQKIDVDKITILRQDSTQFYSQRYFTSYSDSEKFSLMPGDKILVYENINYRDTLTYTINGEVNKPGTYSFIKNISIREAVDIAGGVSELAQEDNIFVNQGAGIIKNVSNDFMFQSGSIITIPKYINTVEIVGSVYNPGLIAYESNLFLRQAIQLSGGYMPNALKNKVYIKRANGKIVKTGFFRGAGKRLFPGDQIFVPIDENPSDFDITSFIADLSITLANITAILLIIDRGTT